MVLRAPISVVVVTRNSASVLPAVLDALAEGLSEGLIRELIVADRGSEDATREMAGHAGAIWVTAPALLEAAMRAGAAVAEGEWILFADPAHLPRAGWAEAVLRHLGHYQDRPAKVPARRKGFLGWLRPATGWLLVSRALYDQVSSLAPGKAGLDAQLRRRLVRLS